MECIYAPFCLSIKDYLKERGAGLDLVIIYRAAVANEHLADVRKYAPQARVVFNTVDLHFLRMEREAEMRRTETAFRQASDMKKIELALMDKVDMTIILSEREHELIRQIQPSARTVHISLARDIPGCLAPFESRTGALFVGGFRHPPNVDGALWLVREIWPRVRRQVPDAQLTIVGGDAPKSIGELQCEGITIAGHLKSLDGIFARSLINLAPLRYGAGVKGKLVTSLSYGVPSVATAIATEGMGLSNGKQVLVADDPDAFASLVVRAMTDRPLWESLSREGLLFAKEHFSIQIAARRLESMLRELGLPSQAQI